MALVLKDRVKEQTTTTGTGTITLGGSISGFESFASVGDGNTTYYAIVNQAADEWEVGIGTYTASGTTLSRDTILESSNSDSAVNFSAGTKDVFVTYPSDKAIYEDAAGGVDINGGTIDGTTIGGSSAAAGTFTTIDFTGADLTASNAAGPALQNEAASSTNPTLVPNRTYLDDGIGLAGDGMLSVALGGAERARFGGTGDRSALELGSGAGTWDSAGLVVNKSGSYTFATDVPNDTAIFLNSQYSASSATHMALRSGNASRQYIYFGDTDDRDVGSLSYDHATDEFKFVAGAAERLAMSSTGLTAADAAGPALLNEAATSTNPTLVPNRADTDTGVGWVSADIGALVAGGVGVVRWDTDGIDVVSNSGNPLLHLLNSTGTPVAGTTEAILKFGFKGSARQGGSIRAIAQGDYSGTAADDASMEFYVAVNDVDTRVLEFGTDLAATFDGQILTTDAAGPSLLNEAATSTNPTLVPNRADDDTGIGWVSADIGALVAGGVNALQWSSTAELTQAISKDSQLGYTIHNTNAGTAAASRLILGNNSDSQDFFIQLNSSTYSGGLFGSGRHVAYVANVGDHVFYNGRVTGTELMRVSTTQVALPDAAGPALLNEAATSTNPTLVPNKADTDTGVGWVSADIGAAIAGGAEAFRWDSSGSIQLQGNVNFDDSNVLMARDGTSFRMVTNASLPVELRTVDAQPLIFKTTNAERMRIDSSGNLTMGDAAGPALLNEAAGATNPTLIPNRVDLTTGWGSGGAGNLDSVVNGVRATLFNTTTSIFYNSIGVEQGRFDRSSGEMNIGPANTPASLLHVREAGSGVAPQAGTVLTVENSGTTAISILAGAANDAALYFGDSGSALAGQVTYHHATDIMDFGVAASTVFSAAAGSFYAADAAGPALLNEAADSDNPTLVPNRADPDTGLGWVSANKLSLVQGGTNRMVIESTTGATGGSGSAGAGNQYVELNLNGVRYKLLHDGTI